jgi:hypothetical protein
MGSMWEQVRRVQRGGLSQVHVGAGAPVGQSRAAPRAGPPYSPAPTGPFRMCGPRASSSAYARLSVAAAPFRAPGTRHARVVPAALTPAHACPSLARRQKKTPARAVKGRQGLGCKSRCVCVCVCVCARARARACAPGLQVASSRVFCPCRRTAAHDRVCVCLGLRRMPMCTCLTRGRCRRGDAVQAYTSEAAGGADEA